MTIQTKFDALLVELKNGKANFAQVIAFIDEHYQFTALRFTNGEQVNQPGQNEGSAKVFALAKLFNLTEIDTLQLFAEHYQSVLATPENNDHANIRNFMKTGWSTLIMESQPLSQI